MGFFGLDIGSNSIKVIELAHEGEKWRLVAAGIAASPMGGLVSQSEKAYVAVAEQIKKLVLDAKITQKNVVCSIPEQAVYTRIVKFPPLTDSEIASAIEWQLESYIPIPKKDAIYDHQIVLRNEQNVEVLLIASPRGVVEKYMKVLELSGFVPLAIETELVALARSIAPPGKRSLIVDFGASSADMAVVVNKQLMFSRSVQTGGEALTRAVAQGIGVAEIQAEEYKKTYGLTSGKLEGKVKQAIDPVVSLFIDEVKKTIAYWYSDHREQVIEIVALSGGTSGLPDFVGVAANLLGIEVTIGNPFSLINRDPRLDKNLLPYAPLYAIAAGLAMRPE